MNGFQTTPCRVCGRKIPKERLEALPGVDTCVDHSDVKPYTEDNHDVDGADMDDLVRSMQSDTRGQGRSK